MSRIVSFLLFLSVGAWADGVVVFNEVMYHPASSEPAMEWVELHNQQAVDVDISGWRLANGVSFTFPPGTRISGRGFITVAVNPSALMGATPGLTGVLGPFTGRLSNSGESLELYDHSGRLMDEVNYGTDDDWPVSADGAGTSLAKRSPNLGSARVDSWSQSAQVGGSPSAANFPGQSAATVSINEIGAAGSDFFVELVNHSAASVNLGGMVITRYSGGAVSYTIPAQSLAPGAFISFPAEVIGVAAAPGDRFALRSADGTQVLDAVKVAATARARMAPLGEWAFPSERTPGSANAFAINDAVVINEIFYHGRPTLAQPAVTETTTVSAMSAAWKYHQEGTDLGTAWRMPGYNDSTWASGPGLLASGTASSYRAAVLADNPVAYWELDDATTSIADSSGNGRNGTATPGLALGSAPLVAGAAQSKAATLSGANRITVPGFEKIGSQGYTVEYWLKILSAPTGHMNLVGDGESASDFFLMNYLTPDRRVAPHFSYGNSPVSLNSNTTLAVGQTYHIATTWDTANPANNGVVYINGVADRTATITRNLPAPGSTGNNTVFIGYDNREPANGSYVVDEVALYNKPLSPARVAAHFAAGNSPGPRNTALTAGANTHYFRRSFTFSGDPANTTLSLNLVADDGAIVWLNGQELYRHNMPAGAARYSAHASSEAVTQAFTGFISVPAEALLNGDNVLAVEVHQHAANNDVLFGLELAATESPVPATPYAESTEQWIELFNKSGATVDLTGWRLDDGVQYLFPSGTQIAAGGYLVVAKEPWALLEKFPGITVLGPFSKNLGRGSDVVVLKDAAGNKADIVEYFDGGRWPSLPDGGGSSLELRAPAADNSSPEAWAASDESTRGAWQTITYTLTAAADGGPVNWNELAIGLLDEGDVLIDDVSVVESPLTTRVQKISNGDFSSGATGWQMLGNHRSSAVEPEPGNPGNQVLSIRASGGTEHMHNHIKATYAGNTPIVDGREYEVSFRAKVLGGSRMLHTRLYHSRVARLSELSVSPLGGTPGAPNSRAVANIGPTFKNLAHSPVVPTPAQAVTIRVQAADPNGVSAATLFYSVNGGAIQSAPMANSGGSWNAAIPGQSAGAIAQFYVRATDSLGATADFPAAGAASRALVIWNDSLADLPLAHNIRLLLTSADRDFMFASANLLSSEHLRGTVIYDESEVFYNVGIRLKGSEHGRPDPKRQSYSISFDPAQPFRGALKSIAVDRSGNWGYAGAPFGQNEILVKHIITSAGGVASLYDDIVRVIVPGTTHTGSALLQMARYSNDWLDSAFDNGSDGHLYKMELIYGFTSADGSGNKIPGEDIVLGSDITDRGSNKENYRWFFLHENHTERDEWDPIIALGAAFSKSGAELDEEVDPLIDGSQWARCFALQTLCGIGDSYSRGNNHNLLLYQRPIDGQILALPWDWDFAFFQATNASIIGDQSVFKVLQRPQYLRLYYAHLQDLCATTFTTGYLSYWTNHYDNFTPGQDFSPLLSYIGNRRASVLSQLPAQAPLTIANAPSNGTLVSNSTLALTGTAPWGATNVQLSGPGGVANVAFSSVDGWSATMPLLLGANVVTLSAFDLDGTLLQTQSFTVVSTATTGIADADGDGLPDAWEQTHDLATLPDSIAATHDSDGDGQSNLAEYLSGTDPIDPSDLLALTIGADVDGNPQLGFVARAGRSYRLLYTDDLGTDQWHLLDSLGPVSTIQSVSVIDQSSPGTGTRFYRLATP